MTDGLLGRLHTVDQRLFLRVARHTDPRIDAVAPRVTTAADHGVLWYAVAASLAATGKDGRRAAVRGLLSMSVASGIANGPAKWIARRPRPALTHVPPLRQLARQPRTTSFPSGHSATAAAFATGVALESPARALPVVAIAAAVAYGRVHIGVHYPSDVVAGVALGVACAAVVRRTWPTPPVRAGAATAPSCAAPALPDGDGLVVVVNAGAESVRAEAEQLCDAIVARLPRAQVVRCDDPDTIEDVLREQAAHATALAVAGGDGTASCAAGICVGAGLPLAVLPAGTLNHFAADLGVTEVDAVLDAIAAGSAVQISVGTAGDGLPFLNTFSLGLYPELVKRRERRERVLGKWPALAVALIEVLGRARPVRVALDGEERLVWLVFGGNGRYHPSGFAPSWRERLDEDVVDVRIVDGQRPWARIRLVAAVLTGLLGRSRVYEERLVDRLTIDFRDPDPMLACDGESRPAPDRIVLQPAARRLVVYRP